MDLAKSYEFFQPDKVKERIHIIGCGSVGSTVAELLTRLGLTKITLYDFDMVEEHNLANQMFTLEDVHKPKVEALTQRMQAINPAIKHDLKTVPDGWKGEKLSGYIFLCVDNIDLRREIVTANMNNRFIKAMFDFRTRMTDSQHYAADWSILSHRQALLDSMDFTQKEANQATPISACGVSLCVMPTVWACSMAGVCNFTSFVNKGEMKIRVMCNPFEHFTTTF